MLSRLSSFLYTVFHYALFLSKKNIFTKFFFSKMKLKLSKLEKNGGL